MRLEGVINSTASRSFGGSSGISYKSSARLLERAFNQKKAPAVAVVINSPGGAPAQSHLVADRIVRLSKEKKIPALAFVEDVAASGGYMIAVGADEIYADPFSIVGSIGVLTGGFGFTELMGKIGVERRLKIAGKLKVPNDPFLKETPEGNAIIQSLLDTTHVEFKTFVKERRGSKLTQPDDVLFEGEFWLAKQAKDYGLIDGVGEMREILKGKFGQDVKLKPFGVGPSWLPNLGGGVSANTVAKSAEALDQWLQERSHWAKVGL